jgi:hypothetical protein
MARELLPRLMSPNRILQARLAVGEAGDMHSGRVGVTSYRWEELASLGRRVVEHLTIEVSQPVPCVSMP